MSRFRHFRLLVMALIGSAFVLVACAEEGPGPQFASDPAPTRASTPRPVLASPVPLPTTRPMATPASIADLLSVRGAPSRVFVASDRDLWGVTGTGEATRLFQAPADVEILDIDPAPGSDEVALLTRTVADDRTTTDVVIVNADGESTLRATNLGAMLATPVAGEVATTPETIDWSPQGDRLLVSFPHGAIVNLPVSADQAPSLIALPDDAGVVESPAWSPTGERIAFVATDEEGRRRALHVLDVGDGSVDQVVVPPEGRFVVDFTWMPNGTSLLFTEGGELGGAVSGIDLWRVDADGENRALVVSAGTVAPVARIANVRPSPDGGSVAYAVLVPGAGSPRVDSVWVRDLESGIGFKIPLPSVAAVNGLWWTDQGLVISVTTRGTAEGRAPARALLQIRRDGSVGVLWAAPIAVGTPVSGTPVATPLTT